jgi:toxin FitB
VRFSLGEITRGIPLKQKSDPKTVAHLTEWLCELRHDYGDRILPIADQIGVEWTAWRQSAISTPRPR